MSNFNLKQISLIKERRNLFLIIVFLLLLIGSFAITTSALNAEKPGISLFLQRGGTLNGMSINPSNPVITVSEKENITGTLKVQVTYNGPSNNVVPFGYTPTWGSHSSRYVIVNSDLPVGTSSRNISINLRAPASAGSYYLIFASRPEMKLGWVMSQTNWTTGSMSWNDGEDIADLTGFQLKKSLSRGYLYLDMLEKGTYKNTSYGIAYVKINVKDANDAYSAPEPKPTKVKTADLTLLVITPLSSVFSLTKHDLTVTIKGPTYDSKTFEDVGTAKPVPVYFYNIPEGHYKVTAKYGAKTIIKEINVSGDTLDLQMIFY
jgi:hypothetical protein